MNSQPIPMGSARNELLNVFITQSQWHATQGATDSDDSRAESIEAVGILDSLLEPMKFDGNEVANAR